MGFEGVLLSWTKFFSFVDLQLILLWHSIMNYHGLYSRIILYCLAIHDEDAEAKSVTFKT